MRKITFVLFMIVCLSMGTILGQHAEVTKANYALAARFSPGKIKKMVFSTSVDAHWLKLSDRFWNSFETPKGKPFYIVDPVRKTKTEIFDNVKMAADLTRFTKDPYDALHLPIEKIKFINGEKAIQFEVESTQEEEKKEETDTTKTEQKKGKSPKKEKPEKKKFYFQYDLTTRVLTLLEDYEKPKDNPRWASISPDGETILFTK